MKDNNILLEVKNLHKTYGKIEVLKGIDFTMNHGEVLGYIGPNGAGKTTTIKLILGINDGDKGSIIKIDGKDVNSIKHDNIISYLPEKINLPEYMTGREYLEHIINLAELNNIISKEDIDEKITLTKFPIAFIDEKIKTYSKGMQQRLGLTSVLLNPNNKLVILDEPVSGLDPIGQDEMIEIIKTLKNQGKSIFLTTHQMNEVEELCDTVCFVKNGKIQNKDTLKNIESEYGSVIDYYKKFYNK